MKVLLSGYYGFGNIGDEAVLQAIVEGLRARDPGVEITVLSASPEQTARLYNVNALNRCSFLKIFLGLLKCDVFVSGGGSLFQNKTSNRSFLYYIGLVWLAKALRKKAVIFAQGFGPLNGRINQYLAGSILNRVDLITLRDGDSLKKVKALGITKPAVKLSADPSFCLTFPALKNTRPVLGIALRELPEKDDYRALAGIIDWLVETYKCSPLFLCFYPLKDRNAALSLAKEMEGKLEIIDKISTPREMLSAMSKLDLLIGMRLHSLIFATMCNVPMLGLSYDPKVKAFMKGIGQPCVRVDQGLDFEKLRGTLEKIMEDREKIKASLRARKNELCERAAVSFEL